MPSYARKHQLSGSLIYHIFNRANGRFVIFHCYEDYQIFIRLLKEYSENFGVKIYHWVIMPNHYHLLFEIGEPEKISKMMAGLARSYSHYYHKTYQTAGFLWQGRFKMQPIQKDMYLLACARYIERNPVRANMVKEACDYLYSSARYYCDHKNDEVTSDDPMFSATFGNGASERPSAYKKFLQGFNIEEEKIFRNFERPLGHREFISKLRKEFGRYIPRRRGRKIERIVL